MVILYRAVVYLRLQNILKPSWFYHILFPSCREASYIMRLFIFASKHLKAFLMLLYLCPSWKNIPKISQCLFDFVIFVSKLEKYPKISQCLFDFVTFCFQAERHMMANNWPCTQSLFYWTITRFNCQQNTHFQSYRGIVVYICISAKHIYEMGDKVRE